MSLAELLWTVSGFIAGSIFGHWLALGRDKRRERREAVWQLRQWAVEGQDLIREGLPASQLQGDEWKRAKPVLSKTERARLSQLLDEFDRLQMDSTDWKSDSISVGHQIVASNHSELLAKLEAIEDVLSDKSLLSHCYGCIQQCFRGTRTPS